MNSNTLSNSLLASVDAERGEVAEALAVLRELAPELYRGAVGEVDQHVQDEAARMLRIALAEIVQPAARSSQAMAADVVGLAIGMPGMGSMQEVARRHGVGRAAVSKRVLHVSDLLGLPPSVYMRAMDARDTYRKTNTRKRKV